jgi:hypothetical protein
MDSESIRDEGEIHERTRLNNSWKISDMIPLVDKLPPYETDVLFYAAHYTRWGTRYFFITGSLWDRGQGAYVFLDWYREEQPLIDPISWCPLPT